MKEVVMTLIARIGRLVKADIHHVLDCIEEPEVILKQALREMVEELERDDEKLCRLNEAEIGANMRIEQTRKTVSEAGQQIETAFQNHEESLSKAFIRKRLVSQKLITQIQEELEGVALQRLELQKRMAERKAKLIEITEKARLFEAARLTEERRQMDRFMSVRSGGVMVTEEEVELAFLEEQRIRQEAAV
jgi:phage shock protein A